MWVESRRHLETAAGPGEVTVVAEQSGEGLGAWVEHRPFRTRRHDQRSLPADRAARPCEVVGDGELAAGEQRAPGDVELEHVRGAVGGEGPADEREVPGDLQVGHDRRAHGVHHVVAVLDADHVGVPREGTRVPVRGIVPVWSARRSVPFHGALRRRGAGRTGGGTGPGRCCGRRAARRPRIGGTGSRRRSGHSRHDDRDHSKDRQQGRQSSTHRKPPRSRAAPGASREADRPGRHDPRTGAPVP